MLNYSKLLTSARLLTSAKLLTSVKLLIVVLCSLVLSACPSVHHKRPNDTVRDGWENDPAAFADRMAWHQGLESWKLTAKIGINTPDIKESANLVWQVNGESNSMRLFGPLGLGSIRIDFNPQGVKLTDTRGRVHQGHSAEALLTEITGWPIPVDALRYWLFVVPAPDAVFQYSMLDDKIVALDQRGWQIDYSKFQPSFGSEFESRPALPRKIVASKTALYGDSEQTANVRLIVKSWTRL